MILLFCLVNRLRIRDLKDRPRRVIVTLIVYGVTLSNRPRLTHPILLPIDRLLVIVRKRWKVPLFRVSKLMNRIMNRRIRRLDARAQVVKLLSIRKNIIR